MKIQEIEYSCEYINWEGKKLSYIDTALTTDPQGIIDKWNRQNYNGKYVHRLISTKEADRSKHYVKYPSNLTHYREQ